MQTCRRYAEVRKALKLSVTQVSFGIGVSAGTLSNYEGRRPACREDALAGLQRLGNFLRDRAKCAGRDDLALTDAEFAPDIFAGAAA